MTTAPHQPAAGPSALPPVGDLGFRLVLQTLLDSHRQRLTPAPSITTSPTDGPDRALNALTATHATGTRTEQGDEDNTAPRTHSPIPTRTRGRRRPTSRSRYFRATQAVAAVGTAAVVLPLSLALTPAHPHPVLHSSAPTPATTMRLTALREAIEAVNKTTVQAASLTRDLLNQAHLALPATNPTPTPPVTPVTPVTPITPATPVIPRQNASIIIVRPPAAPAIPTSSEQQQAIAAIHAAFPPSQWDNAQRVAGCESGLRANRIGGPNNNGTYDWGLFQLNDGGTLQGVLQRTGHNPNDRSLPLQVTWGAQAGARLFAERGWQPWTCAWHLGIS